MFREKDVDGLSDGELGRCTRKVKERRIYITDKGDTKFLKGILPFLRDLLKYFPGKEIKRK